MSYEPRGKVRVLIDAMAPHPEVALPASECAKIMGVPQSALLAYFDAPIRHQALYPINERRYYGITPTAKPRAQEPVISGQIPRETTATGWKPPQMTCTRPTAGTVAHMEQREPAADVSTSEAAGTDAPQFAPALANTVEVAASVDPAPAIEPEAPLDEEQEEAPQSDAYYSCRTGALVIVGIEPDEEGRVTVPADLVQVIRRQLAWMPA